jgi:hypothetical protein
MTLPPGASLRVQPRDVQQARRDRGLRRVGPSGRPRRAGGALHHLAQLDQRGGQRGALCGPRALASVPGMLNTSAASVGTKSEESGRCAGCPFWWEAVGTYSKRCGEARGQVGAPGSPCCRMW